MHNKLSALFLSSTTLSLERSPTTEMLTFHDTQHEGENLKGKRTQSQISWIFFLVVLKYWHETFLQICSYWDIKRLINSSGFITIIAYIGTHCWDWIAQISAANMNSGFMQGYNLFHSLSSFWITKFKITDTSTEMQLGVLNSKGSCMTDEHDYRDKIAMNLQNKTVNYVVFNQVCQSLTTNDLSRLVSYSRHQLCLSNLQALS